MIQKSRGPKSRCQKARAPSGSSRGKSVLCLFQSPVAAQHSDSLQGLFVWSILISFSSLFVFPLSQIPLLFSSLRKLFLGFGANPCNPGWSHLKMLTISAKTFYLTTVICKNLKWGHRCVLSKSYHSAYSIPIFFPKCPHLFLLWNRLILSHHFAKSQVFMALPLRV